MSIESIAHDVDRLYKHSLNGGKIAGHMAGIAIDTGTGRRRVSLPNLDVEARLGQPEVIFHRGDETSLFNYSAQMEH